MQKGDIVKIDYVARVKSTNAIFDLTDENLAKKEGLYDENAIYKPAPVILGSDMVLKGLEEEIMKMKVRDKKNVALTPERAFGNRSPKLIKTFSINEFKKGEGEPIPGVVVSLGNMQGKVLSVSGGRVTVDFNHPLAGKEVEYEIEVKEMASTLQEKALYICEMFIRNPEAEVEKNEMRVKIKGDVPGDVKKRLSGTALKWLPQIEKVIFLEEFK